MTRIDGPSARRPAALRATRRRSQTLAAFVLACAGTVTLLAAAPAAATTTYQVTVYANERYGQSPDFQTLVSPALPPGLSLDGAAFCAQVYYNGGYESSYGIGGLGDDPLDVGTYNFVTSSCSGNLTLPGDLQGTIQLVGGTYTITPDPTALRVIAAEDVSDPANPAVAFGVSVIDQTLDDSPLDAQTVSFGYEDASGLFHRNVCSATTRADGDGNAPGACTITGQDATTFVNGTGTWTATYAGTNDYLPSSGTGQLGGATSAADAATNLQNMVTNGLITVQPTYYPPNCHAASDQTDVSLVGVSLGQLDCTQLKILTITTGVLLGTALGPDSFAADGAFFVADELTFDAVVESLNSARQAAVGRLGVIIP